MVFCFTFKRLNARQQNTILGALQRLRNQHAREGGASFSNSQRVTGAGTRGKADQSKAPFSGDTLPSTCPGHLSHAPSHVLVHHEAGKLLNKAERSQELLTDVLPTSPAYCVEVGKLLSLGAYFGCSTSTPRIADALAWVAQYGETSLLTLRQVMSIATPVTNLADGRAAGSEILWSALMKPLENAVSGVMNPGKTTGYEENLHNRNGIVSVFQMIAKIFSPLDAEGPAENLATVSVAPCNSVQWKRLVQLMDNCTKALVEIVSVGGKTTTVEYPVLELNECLLALTALRALENSCTPEIASGSPGALKLLDDLYSRWMQLLDVSVSNGSTQSTKKSAVVIQLAQLTLSMPSDSKGHRLLQHTLKLMPSALSSSAIKEICAFTQLVNRLRQKFGVAVTPAAILRIMEAARPKIILLSEGAHSIQFRHIESSILMGNLSRWDEIVGESSMVVLSNDLLDLLCSRFVAHMELVWMSHLVPFLQGLCRVENQRRQYRRSTNEPFILMSELRLEHCLEACMKRVVTLSQESKCSALDAAAALRAFTDLGANAESVFLSVKETLLTPVRGPPAAAAVPKVSEVKSVGTEEDNDANEGARMDENVKTERGLGLNANADSYISVVKAVEVFQRRFTSVTQDGRQTVAIAREVLSELQKAAPRYIREASDAAELHSLFNICVRGHTKKMEDDQSGSNGSPIADDLSKTDAADVSVNSEAVFAFLERVEALAPQCGIAELASFSLGVSQMAARHAEALRTMSIIIKELQEKSATLPLPLMELKKVMDSTSKMGYTEAGDWLSRNIIRSVRGWDGVTREQPSWSDLYAILQDLTQFMWSAARVITTMRVIPADARGIYFVLLDRAKLLLQCITDLQLTGANGQIMLSELTFLSFNLSKLYETVVKLDESELPSADEDDTPTEEQKDIIHSEQFQSSLDPDLWASTRTVLNKIGDFAEGLLSSSTAHEESGGPLRKIEPKKIVMLIQSFEKCDVPHTSLMYTLLHELRQFAHLLDPLELSLVMNAALGQGVWNARLMQQLASEVDRKVQESPLRQCHSILFALERSNFFSRQTYLDVSQAADVSSSFESGDNRAHTSPLETLARAALKRMTELSNSSTKVNHLLLKESFLDVINSVRVLSFFHSAPQPLLDTYFMVAAKRFVTFCIRVRQKTHGVSLTSTEIKTVSQAGLYLLQSVHKVRNAKHQRIASVAIQRALFLVEENVQAIQSKTSSEEEIDLGFWSYLSAREIAELMVAIQTQQLFYSPKGSPHTHKLRIHRLYTRLMKAYVFQLENFKGNPRKLHYALQPLFSPGNTAGLPASVLCNKNLLTVLVNLPESTKTVGAVATLIFSAILNSAPFLPSPASPLPVHTAAYDFLREHLPRYLEQRVELLHPSDAILLIQSSVIGLCFETKGMPLLNVRTLEHISSVLLTASLSLSNAVELLLVLSKRHSSSKTGLELDLETAALRTMRAISPMLTRQDPTGYRTLVQVFRLLTENGGIVMRAFIGEGSRNPVLRITCAELVLQAASVVAKAYHSPIPPTHSLTSEKIRRICQCVVEAFPDEMFSRSASADNEVAELCERTLQICDSLL